MFGNYTHILRRTLIVADNMGAQDLAGRNDELAYQLAKRGKELRRDVEAVLTDNNAQVAGNSSTARETGGLGAWVATNESVGTGGGLTTGDGTTARTDGTQRDFTEAMLKDAMQQAFTSGGQPSILMVGPHNKTVVSGFAGIAAQRYQANITMPLTSMSQAAPAFPTAPAAIAMSQASPAAPTAPPTFEDFMANQRSIEDKYGLTSVDDPEYYQRMYQRFLTRTQ